MTTSTSVPRAAFLGLGLMGAGMAHRLLQAGFPLTVYNRSRAKTISLAAAGALVAGSPKDAASEADVIISMVADDAASREVWLGANGALAGVAAGAVCVESSTLSVDWVRQLSEEMDKFNCVLLDAPVTGSRVHAESGALNFLVGGPREALEKARPVLAAMSKSIVPLGSVGSGALVKLINNFLCGVQAASLAEAMAMIERSGLDRMAALEVLYNGAPGSPLVKTLGPRMTDCDYTANFILRLMTKDLGYAVEEGRRLALEMQTAAAALTVFKDAVANGEGEKDFSSVVEQFRQRPVV